MAPFVLAFDTTATAHSIVVGILLVVRGRIRGRMTQRYAGGWRALLRS